MAVTLSRNLKLKIDSSLSANSRYNLERLDLLGATFLTDTASNLRIRSAENITIEPNSADVGGSGTGGTISFGSEDHAVDSISLYATEINLDTPPSLLDQASGGNKYLTLNYKSDISGSVDTTADRSLNMDLQGSDRNLVLGGNLTLTGGNLSLALSSSVTWNIPANGTGVLNNDGSGNLTWATTSGLGTVTSVGLSMPSAIFDVASSPITGSGTIAVTMDNQLANTFLAGPTTGLATTPTFRALNANDFTGIAGLRNMSQVWNTADGASFVITHNWGTRKVDVEVLDNSNNYASIDLDDISRTNDTSITLTASSAPSSSWTVLLQEVV